MHKLLRNILLLTSLHLSVPGFASNTSNSIGKEIAFKVFKAQGDGFTIQHILDSPNVFQRPNDFIEKTNADEVFWIQLDFGPLLDAIKLDSAAYLKLNTFDYGDLFYQKDSVIAKKSIGQFNKNNIIQKISTSYYYSFLNLKAEDLIKNRYLILKVRRVTFNEDIKNWHFTYYNLAPDSYMTSSDFSREVPYYFFAGLCFIMWFSTLSFFFMLRKPEFLYYSIYIIVTFIYVTGNKFGIYQYFFDNNHLTHWISQSFMILANLAYVFFFVNYLRSKKDYPIIHLIAQAVAWLNVITIILIFIIYGTNNITGFIYVLMYAFQVLCVLAILGLIYLLFIGKGPLAYFVALATLAYCIAPIARIYFAEPEDGLFLDSLVYLIVGCSIEMVIFAFGLNYKVHLELVENFQLQQDAFMNKTKALRAQINPHFIFNSLSSIQHLVSRNNKVKTLKYLSKFSRLTRNILESSMETNAMLTEEIKMIQDYLELESLRFDNAFTYKIHVDKNLDANDVEIPFMILQPFVENAIIHGLLPKKHGVKELNINFKKGDNMMICEVDDTGVGRKVATQRLHIYQREKKSRGLEVTRQRLESLGKNPEILQIVDKFDQDNNPLGTKVIINIPI